MIEISCMNGQTWHLLVQPCVTEAEHLLSCMQFSTSGGCFLVVNAQLVAASPPHFWPSLPARPFWDSFLPCSLMSPPSTHFLLFLLFCLGSPPTLHIQRAHLFYLHLLDIGSIFLADIQYFGIFFSVILVAF